MAKIRKALQARLPFKRDNGLSESSLPLISDGLYDNIRRQVQRMWNMRLSRITRMRVEAAIAGREVVITTPGRIWLQLLVYKLSESRAEVELSLPLRGDPPEVQRALEKLMPRLWSREFYPTGGVIRVDVPLFPKAVGMKIHLADGLIREKFVTREEFLVHVEGVARWLPDLTGSVR